jgi:FkbM family methyltransferase
MNLNDISRNIAFSKFLDFRSVAPYFLEYFKSEFDLAENSTSFSLSLSNGRKLKLNRFTLGVLREIFSFHVYDSDIFDHDEISLLDAGGNLGFLPVYYDFLGFRIRGKIVEPDAENIELMKYNLKGLDFQICPYAVEDKERIAKFYLDHSIGNSLYSQSPLSNTSTDEFTEIAVKPFDSLGVFELVKLDVEGAEHKIIRNQRNWTKSKYLMVEFHGSEAEISRTDGIIRSHFDLVKTIGMVRHYKNKKVIRHAEKEN